MSSKPESPAPLTIALVRARYNPYGGAERFAARAAQALGEQGAQVTVLARKWSRENPASNFVMMRCDPFYLGSVWRERSFAKAVHACLARHKFDLVQSHERIVGLPIYRAGDGVHAAWLERRAVGMNCWQRLGLWLNPYHRYMVATERAMFEHPDLRAVICNSVMVRDEILARFRIEASKLHVISNGLDLQVFNAAVRERYRLEMRASLGIAASAPVFVSVGSGFARKGVDVAIAALARSGLSSAMLVVVGADKHAGKYRDLARRFGIADRVHFAGKTSDVLPYYGMADALILPTVYDPFPNVALEAWACGLPVLCSTACGAKEALIEGVNGWLADAGDADGFAAGMRALAARLNTPEEVQELRRAACAAAAPYSLDALGAALIALYRGLLMAGHLAAEFPDASDPRCTGC